MTASDVWQLAERLDCYRDRLRADAESEPLPGAQETRGTAVRAEIAASHLRDAVRLMRVLPDDWEAVGEEAHALLDARAWMLDRGRRQDVVDALRDDEVKVEVGHAFYNGWAGFMRDRRGAPS